MVPGFVTLMVAASLATAPPATVPAVPPGGVSALRAELIARQAPRPWPRRMAARLGASLAWGLADLPKHQARLPGTIGAFEPGALFGNLPLLNRDLAPGSNAIDQMLCRWSELYPPYAVGSCARP